MNKNTIKIDIPKYPKLILDTLHKKGYEAYIVGGCVRDAVMGIVPSDYDITTSAKPLEIKKLFKKTIDTGIKHGTVTVLFYEDDKPLTYEVTSFRVDGEYTDGRHPDTVTFVGDLKEDLLRRDFTVNAMAYSEETGLVDEFGGLLDIKKKVIRAVGNPMHRFLEDALRMLRAIRFSAKLGFTIEQDTIDAIKKLAKNIGLVSKERIQVELTKTITSSNPEFVDLIQAFGLSTYITKDFDKIARGNMKGGMPTHIAYASLLYNTDKTFIQSILRDLKLDNQTISNVIMLIGAKDYIDIFSDNSAANKINNTFMIKAKELINILSYDLAFDFIELLNKNENNCTFIPLLNDFILKCKNEKTPIFISDLAIDGNDLLKLGYEGKNIGIALNKLLQLVYENEELNDKNKLMEYLGNE